MIVPILLVVGAYGAYRFIKSQRPKASTYTFMKGDTAEAVAKRFGTSVAAIMKVNGGIALRMVAPDGSSTTIDLPPNVSDKGAVLGAMGKAVL